MVSVQTIVHCCKAGTIVCTLTREYRKFLLPGTRQHGNLCIGTRIPADMGMQATFGWVSSVRAAFAAARTLETRFFVFIWSLRHYQDGERTNLFFNDAIIGFARELSQTLY